MIIRIRRGKINVRVTPYFHKFNILNYEMGQVYRTLG